MTKVENRLAVLGLKPPPPFLPPPGVVLPFQLVRIIGSRALISGHGPQGPDGHMAEPLGKVGREVTMEEGYAAARLTGLSILGSWVRALGGVDRAPNLGKLLGMVNSAPGFTRHPAVINGVSDLILDLYGPVAASHAPSAIGVAEHPFSIPLEIEAEAE